MKEILFNFFIVAGSFSSVVLAQLPPQTLLPIVKAEDARRYDKTLAVLLKSADPLIRVRAALAAGRIGDESAVSALQSLLENDADPQVRAMAAFALGEIESINAADVVLKALADDKNAGAVRARLTEAAGKIAAANAKHEKAKGLGEAILNILEIEERRVGEQSREVILLGLTAILRARPEKGDLIAAKFLTSPDARTRADAGNTLTRLRSKNFNPALRAMLRADDDASARANAARALGAAEDKEAAGLLLEAALEDEDGRVRVSAIRSLGSLKDKSAADRLLARGEILLAGFQKSKFKNAFEKSELLELAATLSRILSLTNDERTIDFLQRLRVADKFTSPETETALARVAPKTYVDSLSEDVFGDDWRASAAVFQGLGELAALETNRETEEPKLKARLLLVRLIGAWVNSEPKNKKSLESYAIPDLVRAFAAFKSANTSGIFRPMMEIEPDVMIRAALVDVLGDQPPNGENVGLLKKAFETAYLADKDYNDATLAILDALFKLDKKELLPTLLIAVNSKDYLVRKKAFDLLKDDAYKNSEPVKIALEKFTAARKNRVLPFSGGSKLGVVLNTNADYLRAVSRKNGTVKAVFTTEKGAFTIDLAPEDAPLTVDNFVRLARADYFNGVAVHRVVPNFVMQDGDPRGDGNGGPGWQIRCEVNPLPYDRGAVGMALSGKDTGGSQWFVTHSPQPHLDGGYTVFGRVGETDMKTVDQIVRGDKIVSVKIVENAASTPKPAARKSPRQRQKN
jgi:cyclophilin family peptidyl-prolyl cis-trans isomerase/HEAT repeat protein